MQANEAGIVAQMQTVGDVLGRYIEIHDQIFAPGIIRTLRRAIPIPGIFERVPFDDHSARLHNLRLTLEGVSEDIQASGARSPLHDPLSSYCEALRATVHHLELISSRLYAKSDDPGAYESDAYRRDCVAYERSILEYRRAGEALNRALRPLS